MTVLVAKVKCKLNFYVKINKEKKRVKDDWSDFISNFIYALKRRFCVARV